MRRLVSKSKIVREALESSLAERKVSRELSAFDLVKDLCGIVKDGAADMSTNPKYMKNFGK